MPSSIAGGRSQMASASEHKPQPRARQAAKNNAQRPTRLGLPKVVAISRAAAGTRLL